ncbi:MAG: hypothetical protein AAB212_11205 [Bacteroidota bacterium]
MLKIKKALLYSLPVLIGSFFLSACTKNITRINTIYFNDFEAFDLKTIEVSGWLNGLFGPVNDIRITDFNGNKVLGLFNNALADIKLRDLPVHQALRVELDLYLHDNWKNDLWQMSFDGVHQLITGFSNDSTGKQSYPNWIGNGSSLFAAGSDAFETQLPGACSLRNSPRGTSMYKIARTLVHTGNSFDFNCSDAGEFFNLPCQRSWSMDNLRITLINNQ